MSAAVPYRITCIQQCFPYVVFLTDAGQLMYTCYVLAAGGLVSDMVSEVRLPVTAKCVH